MNVLTLVFPTALILFLLLVFSEYLPLLRDPVSLPETGSGWKKRDTLLCLLITAVYALTAFTGLGDREGITTFRCFDSDSITVELKEPIELASVRYYPGIGIGNYTLQVSADGEVYREAATLSHSYADDFKWKTAELSDQTGSPIRFFRLSADRRIFLGELALYDADGNIVSSDAMIYPSDCCALFDEQAVIPEEASFRNSSYFDEIYHGRTALEHILGEKPYEITHPPLGKLLISVGIRIFGMVPFGWRFIGTLFGVLMLPLMYLFVKKMFGGTMVPAACTVILASDFMHFVQTRIATIDTYPVFFTIGMYLFFWLYLRSDRGKRKSWLPPLAASGVCFGLAAASKWTGIYAGAGLGVLWLLDRLFRSIEAKDAGRSAEYRRETVGNILWCLLLFVAVPVCIYYVSYIPYGTAKGMSGLRMLFSRDYLNTVLDNQKYMFSYHSNINATHPYSSVWWQWILDVRPILYYLHYFEDGVTVSTFGAWVNPVLCWGGLLAMLSMAYLALFRLDRTALFILVGYLAQLLPWVFVSRIVFEYHYFPSTVFLLLALGHVFRTVELRHPKPRRIICGMAAASVVLFLMFYPALSGVPMRRSYADGALAWLASWPF